MIEIYRGSLSSDFSSCVGYVTENGDIYRGVPSLGGYQVGYVRGTTIYKGLPSSDLSYPVGYVVGTSIYVGSQASDFSYQVGYVRGTSIYRGSQASDLSSQIGYASRTAAPELLGGGAALLLGLFVDESQVSCPRCGSRMVQRLDFESWECRRCGERFLFVWP